MKRYAELNKAIECAKECLKNYDDAVNYELAFGVPSSGSLAEIKKENLIGMAELISGIYDVSFDKALDMIFES